MVCAAAKKRVIKFAVGFKGWKSKEKLEEKLKCGVVDSIFVIDSKLFASKNGNSFSSGLYSMVMFLERLEEELLKTILPLPVLYNYRV